MPNRTLPVYLGIAFAIGLFAGAAVEWSLPSPAEVQVSGTVSALGYTPTTVSFLSQANGCASSPVQGCFTSANVTAQPTYGYAYSIQLRNGISYQVYLFYREMYTTQSGSCEAGVIFVDGPKPASFNLTCIQGTQSLA